MEIKIYIDLLFLTNFYFDAFLLWLTCLLLHQKPKVSRFLLASAFGGLSGILLFFIPSNIFVSALAKFLLGALMLLICAPAHCLRAFLKHLALFFSLSFCAGGIVSALLLQTGLGALLGAAQSGGIWYLNLPFLTLPLLLISGYLIMRKTLSFSALTDNRSLYPLEIHYNGKSVTLTGFYDSGNLMKSADGRGVIVMDYATVSPLLHDISPDDLPLSIPCYTLQGKGYLPAFLPDKIYIKKGPTKREIKPFCVALSKSPIHHHWKAILPRDFKEMTPYETSVFTENV